MLSVLGGADASWVREGLPFGGVLAPQVGFDGLLQFRGLGEVGVQLGDNPSWGKGFVLSCQVLLGFVDLALLGGGEQVPASRQVIPMR